MTTFGWRGRHLELLDHPYNSTATNERAVEVPIAAEFLRGVTGRGLEVGNVLGHYGIGGHDVVDLYEHAPGVRNIDVFDVEGIWDWIVSISTIEHIGWDTPDRDPHAAQAAVGHLRRQLTPRGALLVTVPLGYHPHLDEAIGANALLPDAEDILVDDGDGWHPEPAGWRPYAGRAHAVWIATWGFR